MKYSGKDSWCRLFGWASGMEANFSNSQCGKHNRPKKKTKEKSLMIKWLLRRRKRHLTVDCVALQVFKKKKKTDRRFRFLFETEGIKNPGALQ